MKTQTVAIDFTACPHERHTQLYGALLRHTDSNLVGLAQTACEVLLEDIGHRVHPLRKESEFPASEPMLLRAVRKDSEWHRFGPEADRGDREYRLSACHWLFRAVQHLSAGEFYSQQRLFDAGVNLLRQVIEIEQGGAR